MCPAHGVHFPCIQCAPPEEMCRCYCYCTDSRLVLTDYCYNCFVLCEPWNNFDTFRADLPIMLDKRYPTVL
jgi:hypothetical protein